MERVLVVGAPGAGKSTFARELQIATALPIVHLDAIYFSPATAFTRNEQAWQNKIKELLSEDSWIIEGCHVVDFAESGQRASAVFFLDYPRRTLVLRLLKRKFLQGHKDAPEMPEGWRDVTDMHFKHWLFDVVLNFAKTYHGQLSKLLGPAPGMEVHVFKNPKAARSYLRQLNSTGSLPQ